MTTVSEQPDSSAPAGPADMSLQTDHAKALVAEIKADNAALQEADEAAESQAEVVVEQAHQLAEAVEEVLEELKEEAAESGHR
jgi:hypothetical protein